MPRILFRALATSCVFLCFALMQMGFTQEPPSPRSQNYPPPKNDAVNVPYWGIVTEVSKTTITVQGLGELPKTFLLSETLATGKIPMAPRRNLGRERGYGVSESFMYRLPDVDVGDWVDIRYAYLGGISICDHVRISKRPGGRVPALPKEAEALMNPEVIWKTVNPGRALPPGFPRHIPYHEWQNAYWDLEDRGIPYPEKFGKDRRWPLAPLPREKVAPTPEVRP